MPYKGSMAPFLNGGVWDVPSGQPRYRRGHLCVELHLPSSPSSSRWCALISLLLHVALAHGNVLAWSTASFTTLSIDRLTECLLAHFGDSLSKHCFQQYIEQVNKFVTIITKQKWLRSLVGSLYRQSQYRLD
jgi:hypothetical protein